MLIKAGKSQVQKNSIRESRKLKALQRQQQADPAVEEACLLGVKKPMYVAGSEKKIICPKG